MHPLLELTMRLFSGLCRTDSRHDSAFGPPSCIGPSSPLSIFPNKTQKRTTNHVACEQRDKKVTSLSPTTLDTTPTYSSNSVLSEESHCEKAPSSTKQDCGRYECYLELSNHCAHRPPDANKQKPSRHLYSAWTVDFRKERFGAAKYHLLLLTKKRKKKRYKGRVQQDWIELAEIHFHRGCELWTQDDFATAMEELESSKAIWEACHPTLLCLMQNLEPDNCHGDGSIYTFTTPPVRLSKPNLTISTRDNASPSTCHQSCNKAVAQLYYAMGMVQLSLQHHKEALMEFRRALQVTVLGSVPHLVDETQYMIRTALLSMGYSSPSIHRHLQRLEQDLHMESTADELAEKGRTEDALEQYAVCVRRLGRNKEGQARVMTKLATIYEQKNDVVAAAGLWSDLAKHYAKICSIGTLRPLPRLASEKVAALQELLKHMEI